MDDVLSLPARLWRSITGDSSGPPLPPPNSDADDAHDDESPNDKQRRIFLRWRRYRKEHETLLEHVKTQESSLKRIEAELQEADRALTVAQSDLKISNETVAELTKSCDSTYLRQITDSIARLSSQLANLDRVIEKRRRHLDDAHFRHNALVGHVGEHTSSLIRQDSFKSISSDSESADNDVALLRTKSELSDLQRQIAVIEVEMQQHRNVLEALQRQSDSIRQERHNFDMEKHRVESERRTALGALSLATGKAKQRHEAVSRCQKRLDELMVAQLNTLVTLDKGREALTVAENMLRQLRHEERQLLSHHTQSPTLSPVAFRRHSSPESDTSSRKISLSVTLVGNQDSLSRFGLLSVTSRLLLFESQDNFSGCMQIAIRVSNIEELSIYNGSLIVSFKQNGLRNSIRFRGDPADLDAVEEVLRPRLPQEVSEIDLAGPAPPTLSPCSIAIDGESAILSTDLLENLMLTMPARYHFDHWRRLYSLCEDGMSLNSLYRCVCGSRAAFLILMDDNGSVFGAFVSEYMKLHPGYFGNGECFVFKFVDHDPDPSLPRRRKARGQFPIYRWSGKNKFFVLCRHDSIAVGGGTHFAIFLQHSLRSGSSGASDTFDSPMLSSTRDFDVCLLEVWGVVGDSPVAALVSEHSNHSFRQTNPNS